MENRKFLGATNIMANRNFSGDENKEYIGDDVFKKFLSDSKKSLGNFEARSKVETFENVRKDFLEKDEVTSAEDENIELNFKDFLSKLNELSTDKPNMKIISDISSVPSSLKKTNEREKAEDAKENESRPNFIMPWNSPSKLIALKPEAVHNFSNVKTKLTKVLFDLFNEKVFDNQLPQDMPILWSNNLRTTAGLAHCFKEKENHKCYITLSSKVLTSLDRLRDTLLHEMCHAAVWLVNKYGKISHGPLWQLWAARCKLILPEINLPQRCHNYAIVYPYKYACRSCYWQCGKYKRSRTLLQNPCAKCGGQVYVTINK